MRIDADRLRNVTTLCERYVQNRDFAGIGWCIEHRGDVISEGTTGFADHALGRPLAGDAIYRIYSMTKPVVSVLALMLLEQNRLRLDDPVARWLPKFGQSRVLDRHGRLTELDRPITIEDLFTHRAGLSYDFLPDCPIAEACRAADAVIDGQRRLADLIDLLADMPLAFQPGARWQYSYATDVLAHLLELVADKSLDTLLEEALFVPLGMRDTGFRLDTTQQSRLMAMFGMRTLDMPALTEPTPQVLEPLDVDATYPRDNPEFRRGGLGLYSTLADYRQFMRVLINGLGPAGQPLLAAPTVDWMWQNRVGRRQRPLAIGANVFAGYGWNLFGRVMIEPGRAMRLASVGEGGWSGAASTYFWVDRTRDFHGIVMTQFLGSMVPLGDDFQAVAYQSLIAA